MTALRDTTRRTRLLRWRRWRRADGGGRKQRIRKQPTRRTQQATQCRVIGFADRQFAAEDHCADHRRHRGACDRTHDKPAKRRNRSAAGHDRDRRIVGRRSDGLATRRRERASTHGDRKQCGLCDFPYMPRQPPEPWVPTLYMAIGRSPCPSGSSISQDGTEKPSAAA